MTTFPTRIFSGSICPLPESGRPTGMYKTRCSSTIQFTTEGITGDQQADRRVHGGPEKAVHLYPASHYRQLAEQFPEARALLVPGTLGENLSVDGLDESQVHIGDIWQLGGVLLQLCQPRNPCWKIDERLGVEGMAAFIAEHGLTGWYFRVCQPGTADNGDSLHPLDHPPGAPTLQAAMQCWQAHRPAVAELEQLAATPGIAAHWQAKITQRAAWLRAHAASPPAPVTTYHVKPATD